MLRDDALGMPNEVLQRLRCPRCAEPLGRERGLACRNGHAMLVRSGCVDTLAAPPLDELTSRTLTSFGYEYTTFVERQREQ